MGFHGLSLQCEFTLSHKSWWMDIGGYSLVTSRPRRLAAVAAVRCRDRPHGDHFGKFSQSRSYETERHSSRFIRKTSCPLGSFQLRGSKDEVNADLMALMGGNTS